MLATLFSGPNDNMDRPVGVVDIGSNSVRLVVYDALCRTPTPIFNEKSLCGLGRDVALTGRLPEDGVEQALSAMKRFRALADVIGVGTLHALATAAARDASNGPEFIAEAERILRGPIQLISGEREAQLAALGVISGIHKPDGIVADLGGGSLELIDVKDGVLGAGVSLKLGGLALRDLSGRSLKKASKIVQGAMDDLPALRSGTGRDIFAIGGTWRAIARLHMRHIGYPLNVLHDYAMPADEAIDFCRMVTRVDPESLTAISSVAVDRRPLLAYGALVLDHLMKRSRARRLIVSALGVREGLLYELLDNAERAKDPLLMVAGELNKLRSRSPAYTVELAGWTDGLFAHPDFSESEAERRLRLAACLLSDISWRAHPDYRGEQSLNVIAHAVLPGVDHAERVFLALSVYYRHIGPVSGETPPRIRELAPTRMIERARLLGAAMRTAYLATAAMPGVLKRVPIRIEDGALVLTLPQDLADLANERLFNRLKQLAKLIGREPVITIAR
ncbi:MAG TPA: Ppx/GppA phosphatase family protein [Beijerinckiaceae bacterium]|nr:Ppx/GppA phosphatase family protein [Beijerinckiaceae bacterium]